MQQASDLPPPSDSEVYRGYYPEDIARVQTLRPAEALAPSPDFVIDYFGVRTRNTRAAWMNGWSNVVMTEPPFPGDGFLCDGIEYAAAAIALEHANGPTFTCVEVGAGWGPWTALMATLAGRREFEAVNAIGIEAAPSRFAMLTSHLADNGLLPSPDVTEAQVGKVHTKAIRAAGWWRETTMYFPRDDQPGDAGMAATEAVGDMDYRGVQMDHVEVPAVSIPDLCAPYAAIDFMHIDIQGGEWELISNAKTFFDQKVRCMFLGTHDRKIEGDLIALLMGSGWKLFREKPCRFYGMADSPTLAGLTYEDGAQFWLNMMLA